jgi:hypothetical protein
MKSDQIEDEVRIVRRAYLDKYDGGPPWMGDEYGRKDYLSFLDKLRIGATPIRNAAIDREVAAQREVKEISEGYGI